MLIVCWNVAGLSTTAKRICSAYGQGSLTPPGSSKSAKRPNQVLSEFLKRHGSDIFCVQEHKIPLSQLSTRSEPMGCADVEGYESFWSCCIDQKKKGFNGVVTYVKKGKLPVLRANSRPLGSADLDDQGRCVMTDHGTFVLFNVYVPASSGQPLSYKMKFLNALRNAMRDQRVRYNKKVVLVGDLNISHRPRDKFWCDRVLFVDDIRRSVAERKDESILPPWKTELASNWPQIEAAMTTKQVVSMQTKNSLTGQKYDKYRLMIMVNGNKVFLGSHESSPEYCEYCYDFSSWKYKCADTNEEIVAEEDNVVSISVVAELMMKIVGIKWEEALLREIATTDGKTSRISPPRRWLNAIIEEDGMVDAFEHFYPDAEGRYTCWHQFTNKRYTNEGARIDFTLVDGSLANMLLKGDVSGLRCGCSAESDASTNVPPHHPNSEAAALCAATANGGYQPVSFEGGGIIEATQSNLDKQFGNPHTGMIYTPPSFSDHTAISLLLKDDIIQPNRNEIMPNDKDPSTKKAQPHKAQKSIASFFVPSTSPSTSPGTYASKPSCSQEKKRKNSIQKFFICKTELKEAEDETFSKRSKSMPASNSIANDPKTETKTSNVVKKGSILAHFLKKT